MTHIIQFAGVTAAIVGSMALALGIEWLSLSGLMRLMPCRPTTGAEKEKAR